MVAQDGPIVKELQDGRVNKDNQAWASDEGIRALKSKLGSGVEIVTPESPEYKDSILRWSDYVEKPAGLIVYVKSPQDVAACLAFVQEHDVDFAVCGGKHSSSGTSSSDGGLVIDLGHMREVSIDKEKMEIHVQGGCIWKDVDEAAGPHDLAMVGGTVNHTGVAGLTLGGGYGWLSGRHGLTVDGLLSCEVVLGDGRILRASDEENSDLLWALKGAGHSFAVVTEFVFRARKQKNEIWAGQLVFNPDEALEPIIAFANHLAVVTDGDSGMAMALGPPPFLPKPGIVTTLFFNGPKDKAEELFKPLLDLPAIKKDYGLRPYSTMNSILNFAVGYGGRKCTKGGSAITPLNPGFVQNLLLDLELLYKTVPNSRRTIMNIEIFNTEKWTSVPRDATSFFNRGKYQNVVIGPCWEDAQYDDVMKAWGQNISKKFFTEINFRKEFFDEEVAKQDIREYGNYDGIGAPSQFIFGSNYPRLVELKQKYDPKNVFDKDYDFTSTSTTSSPAATAASTRSVSPAPGTPTESNNNGTVSPSKVKFKGYDGPIGGPQAESDLSKGVGFEDPAATYVFTPALEKTESRGGVVF